MSQGFGERLRKVEDPRHGKPISRPVPSDEVSDEGLRSWKNWRRARNYAGRSFRRGGARGDWRRSHQSAEQVILSEVLGCGCCT